MRPNKLRELLRAGKPTLGTRVMSPWPTVIEVLGQARQFDYVEFLAEYSPNDLHDLDNLCRAAELADLTPIIKIDQAGCEYVRSGPSAPASRASCSPTAARPRRLGTTSGSSAGDSAGRRPVRFRPAAVFPRSQVGGSSTSKPAGCGRDFDDREAGGRREPGRDPGRAGDRHDSVGARGLHREHRQTGARSDPETKAVERKVFETAIRRGIPARAEIVAPADAEYYLDLGVRHFSLNVDLWILLNWWAVNGKALREKLLA